MADLRAAGHHPYGTLDLPRRHSLLVNWTCTGAFNVNDPMAEPYAPTSGVRVGNDWRWHRAGSRLDAVMPVNGHVAYRWGGRVQAEVVLYWIGVLLVVAGLVVATVGLARRGAAKVATWIALVAGTLLIGVSGSF